jgi:hypothetical protein
MRRYNIVQLTPFYCTFLNADAIPYPIKCLMKEVYTLNNNAYNKLFMIIGNKIVNLNP